MTDDMKTMGNDAGWARGVGELRRAPRVEAAAIDRVMADVLAAPAIVDDASRPRLASTRGRVIAWLVRPRTVALTPLHAIAAALLVTVAVGGALRWWPSPARVAASDSVTTTHALPAVPARTVSAADPRRVVQFVFVSHDAREVAIVGDFNDWRPGATKLTRASARGVWTVEVGLEPGRYTYAFVVDGTRWVPDEAAPRARDDEFGGEKSVIYVRKQT